ncbi:hypothetical protein B9T29_06195 [Acinetobacter sp. ANC 3903]|uniref:hypothetical protein n=1 Tax=Acinetobacter sp. ANC 3903 TaxID=1977883 RepID=UPI000A34125C|nr:hypothetical protein [Acinetobacter sp. ANC 3903]OTG62808.1 hypothetical protein B9T29_06195 [Acinetobacter sp. ANC 3903]
MSNKAELILIADDEKLLEIAKGSKIKFDKQLALDIAEILSKFFSYNPFAAAINTTLTFLNKKERAKESKNLKALPLLKEQILRQIKKELNISSEIKCISPNNTEGMKFDIGDKATNGSFYLKHPLLDNVYIRPCNYEAVLAREKEACFRRLASALGAKTITLKDAKFFDNKGKLSVGTTIPQAVCTNIGINVQFEKDGAVIKEVYSEFGEPRVAPYIPEHLKSWTMIDTDLRTMAQDRLEGHLIKHQVTLQFKESFSGGGKIAAEIADKGLDIGGSISNNVSSVWFFEVEYYPITETI